MAEYIGREALQEQINDDCKYAMASNDYQRGCNEVCDWAIKIIKNAPTADVVPRAEYEGLEKDYLALDMEFRTANTRQYNEGKAEAVREIFEEIEKHLVIGTTYYGHCIYTLGVGTFAELKKKYTEGKE